MQKRTGNVKAGTWFQRFRKKPPPESEPVSRPKKPTRRVTPEQVELLEKIAELHGLDSLKRHKVEKLNGQPSFYQNQRMMARVQAARSKQFGATAVDNLASEPEELERFAASHGIKCHAGSSTVATDEPFYRVHAFYGDVGLIEKIANDAASQFSTFGENLGTVRPSFPADPEAVIDLDPTALAALVSQSATLSGAIPRPYVQLDWVVTDEGGPSLESLDLAPVRLPFFVRSLDIELGQLFEDARARTMIPAMNSGALSPRVPGGKFVKRGDR